MDTKKKQKVKLIALVDFYLLVANLEVNVPEAFTTKGNEATYEYNFDPKTYVTGSSLDAKGNLDLPYKSTASDSQSKNYLGQSLSKDYLQGSGFGNYISETSTFQSKPYTSSLDNKGTSDQGYLYAPTELAGTTENKESKGYSYTPISYDTKGQSTYQAHQEEKSPLYKKDDTEIGMGNYEAKSYSMIKDSSVDKKDDKSPMDILNRKELQQSIYVGELKESRITSEPLAYQINNKVEYGFQNTEGSYDSPLKHEVKASFVDSQKSPEKKSYMEFESQMENNELREYGSGSYPYGSDYKDVSKERSYLDKEVSSPEPRGYQEELGSQGSNYKAEWYQNSEEKKRYVSMESDNLYGKGSEASGQKGYSTNYYGYESESPSKY